MKGRRKLGNNHGILVISERRGLNEKSVLGIK
jgi:hypothetical protein